MYMNRRIKVNLTKENEGKLEKPSKVFNKIKAVFSGGMTPAETGRAEVMLCVLQRVNKSLRAAKICNLVSLAVNDQTIYQDQKGIDNDLKEGVLNLIHGQNENNITVFKRLEQIVEYSTGDILFVYDINVLQKPKKGEPPVTITVSGFPSLFKFQKKEKITNFESRITNYVKKNLSTGEQVKQFNEKYLSAFDDEVDRFTIELEKLFPAGCNTEKYRMLLLSKGDQERLKNRVGDCFESDILYMDYWLNAETISSFDDDVECDDLFEIGLCDWFDDVLGSDSNSNSSSGSSWIDSVSESFSDSSYNDSSCGSSCGGSCCD